VRPSRRRKWSCGFAPACLYTRRGFAHRGTALASLSHAVVGYLRSFLARQRGEEGGDRELLRRFAEGRDGDAFALLLQRHGPMVLGLARRVVGDWQLAEDVF
jgi:hypothetical protein